MATATTQTVFGHRKVLQELTHLDEDTARNLVEKCKEASLKSHPAEHQSVKVINGTDMFRVRAGTSRAMIDYHMGRVRILKVGKRDGFYSDDSIQKAKTRSYQQ